MDSHGSGSKGVQERQPSDISRGYCGLKGTSGLWWRTEMSDALTAGSSSWQYKVGFAATVTLSPNMHPTTVHNLQHA